MLSRREFLGEAAALALAGCTTTQEQPATLPPTPTTESQSLPQKETIEMETEGVTFVFGKGVSEEKQKEIKESVALAAKWFKEHDMEIKGLHVFAFPDANTTTDNYLARSGIPESPGWNHASPIIGGPAREGRYHTVAHELFHVWQRQVGAYKYEPVAWLNEGIPHYIAALFLKEAKLYEYGKIRNGHTGEATKVKELLSSLERNDAFYRAGNPQTADEYSLAFLAVEFLTHDLPDSGIAVLRDYWKRIAEGVLWRSAFSRMFGNQPEDFYKEFEPYRQRGFK